MDNNIKIVEIVESIPSIKKVCRHCGDTFYMGEDLNYIGDEESPMIVTSPCDCYACEPEDE